MPGVVRIRTQTETEGACSQPGFHHRKSLHRSLLMEETLAAISASITAVQHFYALEFSVAAVEIYENIQLSSLNNIVMSYLS